MGHQQGIRWRIVLITAMAAALLIPLLWGNLSFGEGLPASPHAGVEAQVETDAGHGDEHGGGHSDPFTLILLELAVIVLIAILGRYFAGRLNQPSVLGELIIGLVVGNIGYQLGLPWFHFIMHMGEIGPIFRAVWSSDLSVTDTAIQIYTANAAAEGSEGAFILEHLTGPNGPRLISMTFAAWMFSSLGVIMLLFMVGLESSVVEMKAVGVRATLVAIVGVVAPFVMGYLAGVWLLPESGMPAHLFLGATLCATSVGITARVFKDLDKIQTKEAKVILGAAVIDDVLGLIILAVVVGVAATGRVDPVETGRIALFSFLFLGAIFLFGERLMKKVVPAFEQLDKHNSRLLLPLALAFLMAWAANLIQLAAIVGAFAAGLIITDELFAEGEKQEKIEELVQPLEATFAPVFFVLMGMQVNLETFADPQTLILAGVLTVVAVLSKICAGFVAGGGVDKISVGIGMIPRGEVGLIFASVGKAAGVVDAHEFSAIVIVVMLTTMITPLGLRWSLFRKRAAPA